MVTPTENGCYYYQETAGQGKESYVLMYRDFASGKSVPVCAKPNCKHDGSEYCTASSHVYAPSHLEYHDGYLYALTTKFLHPEKRGMNSLDFNVFVCTDPETGEAQMVESTEDCHQVLLRYSPDGTQIEELYDFGTGKGISRCLFHRGYIWCLVQLQTSGESTENTITNDSSSFINGGWQLWGYELASGKTVLLCDGRPKPGVNHVNPTPSDFSASGDYLYFCRCGTDWSGSQNALSRISLLTGREETVLRNDEYGYSFCMTKVLCKDKPKQIKSRTIPYYSVMDLITREKSESRPIFDQNYDFDGKKYQIMLTSIFMDEDYIIADGWELSDPNSNVPLGLDENASDKTFVLDHDLNLISITDKFVNKIDMATLSSTESTAEFHFDGTEALCEYQGWLYVVDLSVGIKAGIGQVKEPLNGKNSYTVKRFPISDLLSGEEPHYETVYTYEY